MDKASGRERHNDLQGGSAMVYLGIDVSKVRLDCVLLDPVTDKRKSKTVSNDPAGLEVLSAWLVRQGVALGEVHGVMEATGVYHEQAALWLSDAGMRVSVVNPALVRDFAKGLAVRTKTDGTDSVALARYGALIRPKAWQAPPLEVRELKALIARLEALEADARRERNRREKALIAKAPTLVQASLDSHLEALRQEIARLRQAIDDHIGRHPGLKADRARLLSIPAVGEKTANRMLAVLHSRKFTSAEQVAAFLGVVPVEHQSGSSIHRRPQLAKNGDAKTRAVLYMAAVVAIRYNPHVKALYSRLCAKGKAKKAALGAAMRKLVHLCFGVIKHQTPYQPNWAARC
jgi:transposase